MLVRSLDLHATGRPYYYVESFMKTLLTIAMLAALSFVGAPAVPAAAASCMEMPPPAKTVFTGTVTATAFNGRLATVTTDDGRTVTVTGTPDLEAAATSVDRTYQTGARYEFHALNDTSPYEDNACTQTRQLSGPGRQKMPNTGIIAAGAGLLIAVAVAGIWLWRGPRKTTSTAP